MTPRETLLAAIAQDPADGLAWLALADQLEEDGQPDRAELLRLTRRLGGLPADAPARPAEERRLTELLGAGVRPCVPEATGAAEMRLALVPAGRFLMGSPAGEDRRHDDEFQHPVEITRPFWFGVYPVTQAQYRRVMGVNPSSFSALGEDAHLVPGPDTGDFPVETVSWDDAVEFCGRLTRLEGGGAYRLPSEAEWEYACRAGTTGEFHYGEWLSSRLANFDGETPYRTHEVGPALGRPCPVGQYAPNAWGLYDMHGNLDEWCHDWYEEDYYRHSPAADPPGPESGEMRVLRGGTWSNGGRFCRSAFRWRASPDMRQHEKGFRVVRERG
ncbi:MAG: SUMF1/EgtB/PvdO family nonheme iron enzyme [Gemmataceae bacterium]